MKNIFTLSTVLILGIYSCTNSESQKDKTTIDNNIDSAASTIEIKVEEQIVLPQDTGIKEELAIVKKAEGGPYPYYYATFYFTEQDTTVDIYLDIEEIAFYEGLYSLINDTVLISYKDVTEYKIKKWGNPLNDNERRGMNPEWKELTGKLTGAEEVNVGDTYDQLFIENEDVPDFSFNYYTDSGMAEDNNKIVTVYYTSKKAIKVTAIRLVD